MPWLGWMLRGHQDDDGDVSWTGQVDRAKAPELRKQLVKLMETLIDNGSYKVVNAFGNADYHPLAQLLRFGDLDEKQRQALLDRALARGADPATRFAYPQWKSKDGPGFVSLYSSSALDVALSSENESALAKIVPRVKPEVLADAYLRYAIRQLSSTPVKEWTALLDRAGDLDRVVEQLDNVDIGAVIHFACAADVAPEYLEALIGRVDLAQPLTTAMTFSVSTSSVKLKKGATARDIVEAIIKRAKNNTDERAAAERKLELLTNIKRGKTAATKLRPAIAATAEQVLRLAELLGSDPAPIQAAIEVLDDDALGPWSFLHEMISQFEDQLMGGARRMKRNGRFDHTALRCRQRVGRNGLDPGAGGVHREHLPQITRGTLRRRRHLVGYEPKTQTVDARPLASEMG